MKWLQALRPCCGLAERSVLRYCRRSLRVFCSCVQVFYVRLLTHSHPALARIFFSSLQLPIYVYLLTKTELITSIFPISEWTHAFVKTIHARHAGLRIAYLAVQVTNAHNVPDHWPLRGDFHVGPSLAHPQSTIKISSKFIQPISSYDPDKTQTHTEPQTGVSVCILLCGRAVGAFGANIELGRLRRPRTFAALRAAHPAPARIKTGSLPHQVRFGKNQARIHTQHIRIVSHTDFGQNPSNSKHSPRMTKTGFFPP